MTWFRKAGGVDSDDKGEEGAVTVFVVGLALVLMAVAGLVVDGGGAINARQTLADDVEQAARAGATAVNINASRAAGRNVLDRGLAEQRARDYLVGLGYPAADISFPASMPQTDGVISVQAKDVVPTKILLIAGIQDFPITAATSSVAAAGIDAEVP
jgi:hypothetical protein